MHNALASLWAHRLAQWIFGLAQLEDWSRRWASMSEEQEPNKLYDLGGKLSSWASDFAAHPYVQIAFVILCIAWFASGLPVDILTAALSILAISLTQMVLNRQNVREAEAHRRDVAMHAKLDELVIASRRARDEMAGIEELDEEDIVELKEHAEEARDAAEKAERALKRKRSQA